MSYKVSVVVPVYNAAKYVERCVDSLMQQTLKEMEYIFVDDCSTDGSRDALMEALSRYPERRSDVRLIQHDVNKGVSASRNDGIGIAAGEFIAFCDSDDWVDVTMYEKMYDAAKSEGAELCVCGFISDYGDRQEIHRCNYPQNSRKKAMKMYLCQYITPSWNLLIARTLLERIGAGFAEDLSFTEDFFMAAKLIQSAEKLSVLQDPLYFYNRMNSQSLLHTLDSESSIQERNSLERTVEWLNGTGAYEDYRREMSWRLLKNKAWLISENHFDEFRNLHSEANRHVLSIPSSFISLKTKAEMILALLHLDFICRWDNRRHGRF